MSGLMGGFDDGLFVGEGRDNDVWRAWAGTYLAIWKWIKTGSG